jgi:hypothetical protein
MFDYYHYFISQKPGVMALERQDEVQTDRGLCPLYDNSMPVTFSIRLVLSRRVQSLGHMNS